MLSRIISEVVPGTKIHAALDIPSMIGYRTFDTNNDKAKEKNMFAWGYAAKKYRTDTFYPCQSAKKL